MQVNVNGTRLWFDVEGVVLAPSGSGMKERPTVVLVHGGPGTYDHSYFKPDFSRLAEVAQVVYLDLRRHGRSEWGNPADWNLEACADDIREFIDALGIEDPILLGHSMGGTVALLYGARHPGHAAGLMIISSFARFDLERLSAGFRRVAGGSIAELARREYGGETVSKEEWASVFAAFGPKVPNTEQLFRRVKNVTLAESGMALLRRVDIIDQLKRITCPTLICVGELDPVTPPTASHEIASAITRYLVHYRVIKAAGHFPWLDAPDRFWSIVTHFACAARYPELLED